MKFILSENGVCFIVSWEDDNGNTFAQHFDSREAADEFMAGFALAVQAIKGGDRTAIKRAKRKLH